MSDFLRQIQGSINERQQELHHIADLLARKAVSASWRSAGAKTAIVILGAFGATRGAADQLLVNHSSTNLIIYTMAGLLVAAVAGLDAAFKFDRTAAELRLLASICHSTVREVDTQWQAEIGAQEDRERQVAAALKLVKLQDTRLTEIQQKAAAVGVNITWQVRELVRQEGAYAA